MAILALSQNVLAYTGSYSISNAPSVFPLHPRVIFGGTTGSNNFGSGDGMIPLWGNADQFFYSVLEGKYGESNAWLESGGLGGRKIMHDAIFGTYVFADYNRSSFANFFPIVNPGLELITNQWDTHINGYIPVGNKIALIDTLTGNQLGLPAPIFFKGHTQYADLFDLMEEVGPGADTEVGYTFNVLNRARIFSGAYYFSPRFTVTTRGLEAGVELPLKNQASLEFRDSYDNVRHNIATITLRLTFGGIDKTGTPEIHDRLLDRIPRHLANLYNGDGIPSQTTIANTGRKVITRDNIWFFTPDFNGVSDEPLSPITSIDSCTFEHPCIGLGQVQLDAINGLASNANLYLASGNYDNPALGSGFSFYNGQAIFGRSNNYALAAIGSLRPTVDDTFTLNGNNTVDSLQIQGNTIITLTLPGIPTPETFQLGVYVPDGATGFVTLSNDNVEVSSSSNSVAGFLIAADNLVNTVSSSTITVNSSLGGAQLVLGVADLSNAPININASPITVVSSGGTANNLVFGIVNNAGGAITLANTPISVTSDGGQLLAAILNNSTSGIGSIMLNNASLLVNANYLSGLNSGTVAGLLNNNNGSGGISGNVDIVNTSISVNATAVGAAIPNQGMTIADVFGSGTGTVLIDHSTLITTANADGATVANVFNGNTSLMSISDQSSLTLINNGTDDTVAGIFNSNTGTLQFDNSTLTVSNTLGAATPNLVAGVLNNNSSSTTFTNGSLITVNNSEAGNTAAIFANDTSFMSYNNSTISVNLTDNATDNAASIFSNGGAITQFTNALITVNNQSSTDVSLTSNSGGVITLNNSTLTLNNSSAGIARGIFDTNSGITSLSSSNATLNNSQATTLYGVDNENNGFVSWRNASLTLNNQASGLVAGLLTNGNANTSFAASTLTLNNVAATTAYGIENQNNGSASLDTVAINITSDANLLIDLSGIYTQDAGFISVNNVGMLITNNGSGNGSGIVAVTGIKNTGGSSGNDAISINSQNTTITLNNSGATTITGVSNSGNGNITFNGNNSGTSLPPSLIVTNSVADAQVIGFFNSTGTLNLNDMNFVLNNSGGGSTTVIGINNIDTGGTGTTTTQVNNAVLTLNNSAALTVYGVLNQGQATVNFNSNSSTPLAAILINNSGTGGSTTITGFDNEDVGSITIDNSNLTIAATGDTVTGLVNNGTGPINLQDSSTISLSSSGATPTLSVGTITTDNSNTCIINGVSTSC